MREMSASEPLVTHRNALGDIRTGVALLLQEECGGNLPTGHAVPGVLGGMTLVRALVRNLRTCPAMPREKVQAAKLRGRQCLARWV